MILLLPGTMCYWKGNIGGVIDELSKVFHVLPVLCNCDHLAMQAIHATLIREGTCVTSDECDYCIVGDKDPLAKEYELVKQENGLLVSIRKNGW